MQRVPSCRYPTNHGWPPSRKTRKSVSSLHKHRGWLLRPVLRYCTQDYQEEVAFPLHMPNYSCRSCWNRSVHGRQFVCNGSGAFVPRRGTPAIIWSDNGTNFVGAKKELRENIEKWNAINIAVEFVRKGIKGSSIQDGIWERLVRSFKRILYTILGTRCLADEVLNSTFCLAEHALNSRPLTPVSADPSDLGAITPNHFLLGN